MRDDTLETLSDADAVLVIDETGFLKQGKASCGVGRQYTGSAGEITNCQIGVFATYVSGKGHAFIDRQLYLPKAWTDDSARLAAAHVPPETGFASMIGKADHPVPQGSAAERRRRAPPGGANGRACDRGRCPLQPSAACGSRFLEDGSAKGRWVTADSAYGVGELEMLLRRAGKGYLLGVNATQPFNSWIGKPEVAGTAEDIALDLEPSAWQRLSAGAGSKGPRLHDWAYLELADLEAGEVGARDPDLWTRGLLIRRNRGDQSLAFFSTWCPAGTTIETLVAVEGRRWTIDARRRSDPQDPPAEPAGGEDSFETARNKLGLDHNESRSWHGWHRHVSLVMLAFAMLARVRHHANLASPPKTMPPRLATMRPHSSSGRSRRSVASPRVSRKRASGPPTSSPGRSGDGRTKPAPNAHIRD